MLAAYVKIDADRSSSSDSDLPDEPWFAAGAARLLPASRSPSRFADDLADATRCSREIITTCVVNDMVNRAGTTFVLPGGRGDRRRLAAGRPRLHGRAAVFDLRAALGGDRGAGQRRADRRPSTPATARSAGWSTARTRWLLDVRYPIARRRRRRSVGCRPAPCGSCRAVPDLLRGAERRRSTTRPTGWSGSACRGSWRCGSATCSAPFLLLDVVGIAEATGRPAAEVAELHYALSERFRGRDADRGHRSCRAPNAGRRWPGRHCATTSTPHCRRSRGGAAGRRRPGLVTAARDGVRRSQPRSGRRTRSIVASAERGTLDLATLSVALRVMRGLPGRSWVAPPSVPARRCR